MKENRKVEIEQCEDIPFNLQLQTEIDYKTFGRRLRAVRKKLGYTQAQFSEIMGLKPNYYGQYETGSRHINFPRFVQFICKTQCSADQLLVGCHKDYPSAAPAKLEYTEKRRTLNSILDKCDDDLLTDLIVITELMQKRR